MTSTNLIALLRDLQYEDVEILRPANLALLCNDRNFRKFLDFLVANVKKETNFVSKKELKRFNSLKSDGRAIVDADERRAWIRKKASSAGDGARTFGGDVEKQELSNLRTIQLEAAKKRLRTLRALEERMTKMVQQKIEAESKKEEYRRLILDQCQQDLRKAQTKWIGVNKQFRDTSTRVSAALKRIKLFALNPEIMSSIFLTAATADKCVSSIQHTLVQSTLAMQWYGTVAATGGSDFERDVSRLLNGFQAGVLEQLVEETKLTDLQARLKFVPEMEKSLDDIPTEENVLRSSISDATAAVQSKRDEINTHVNNILMQDADTESELLLAKAHRVDCHRKIDHIDWLMVQKNQVLAIVRNESVRIGVLRLLISEERNQLQQRGLQPMARLQSVLCDRILWMSECKVFLDAAVKKDHSKNNSSIGEESAFSTALEERSKDSVEELKQKRWNSIMELIARSHQLAHLCQNIADGNQDVRGRIAKCVEISRPMNEELNKYKKAIETKKRTGHRVDTAVASASTATPFT